MELEEIAKRLKIWSDGGKVGPVRIELHPTDSCNLNCIFCWRKGNRKPTKRELSEKRLLKIVKEAAEMDVREWIVSGGGEPLVRKSTTLKILKEIKKFGMWGLLTTNGTLLNESDAKFLIKIGWDQVQFSIDGPNEKINDFLRPPNSFKRITKNVSILRELREKSKSSKPYIGFNTVINKMNYKLIPEMIELAYEVGSDLVFFEPIYPGYSKIDLKIPKKDKRGLKKIVRKGERVAKKLKIDTNIRDFLEIQLMDKTNLRKKFLKEVEKINGFLGASCFRPWYLMGIKASGFSGCCSTFEIGEFIQNKSLKEVWYGKLFNKLRKKMLEKNPPYYCDKCSIVVLMENRTLRKMLMGL